ncbi:Exopolyphosphatase [Emydomyces testavorans]|uniref:Exopolyphosphatase n=1 Tax=Emydomyces testavorans TaxID=2070801 RepID=A0AAF0DCX6_9EURO|nr:Exopolyphosphatase [Emydomyces testavorans]
MSVRIPTSTGLLQFLKQATQYPLSPARPSAVVYVVGNPSADLDSIISAVLYSYFATSSSIPQREGHLSRFHVPVINLHDVPSGRELGRLRPEFATALKLATKEGGSDEEQNDKLLKDTILTVADLRERLRLEDPRSERSKITMDVVMVDWNALPVMTDGSRGIEGISDVDSDIRVSVKGCIDHHDDEKFVPPDTAPRRIQTGVGSCMSLIVAELRSRGLWKETSIPATDNGVDGTSQTGSNEVTALIHESQAAKLALAAILTDTTNMTAKDKVLETDRLAVSFLEDKIKQAQDSSWNRDEFYGKIAEEKISSVDKLTMQEILGKDYKDWIDELSTPSSNEPQNIKLGICSVVKPLAWLMSKAAQEEDQPDSHRSPAHPFFDSLYNFARSKNLDAVAVMTAYTSQPHNQFHRELLVWLLNKTHSQSFQRFEALAIDQLALQDWPSDSNEMLNSTFLIKGSEGLDSLRIWQQTDVTKSRKQVAPLLRKVMTQKL